MFVVKSNKSAETVGAAPKMAWPTVALAAVGALLCILDGVGAVDLNDGVWLAVLGSALGTGTIGWKAPPALQKTRDPAAPR
jgi:hypothetical protein